MMAQNFAKLLDIHTMISQKSIQQQLDWISIAIMTRAAFQMQPHVVLYEHWAQSNVILLSFSVWLLKTRRQFETVPLTFSITIGWFNTMQRIVTIIILASVDRFENGNLSVCISIAKRCLINFSASYRMLCNVLFCVHDAVRCIVLSHLPWIDYYATNTFWHVFTPIQFVQIWSLTMDCFDTIFQ